MRPLLLPHATPLGTLKHNTKHLGETNLDAMDVCLQKAVAAALSVDFVPSIPEALGSIAKTINQA